MSKKLSEDTIQNNVMNKKIKQIKGMGYNILFAEYNEQGYLIEYIYKDGQHRFIDSSDSEPEEKLCCQCGIIKKRNAFYNNKMTRDGLQSQCKDCFAKRAKKDAIKKKRQEERRRIKDLEIAREKIKTKREEKTKAETKRCATCKLYLPLDEFHSNISKTDGLHTECKKCKADRDKKRRVSNKEILSFPVTEVVQGEKIIWRGQKYVSVDYAQGMLKQNLADTDKKLNHANDRIKDLTRQSDEAFEENCELKDKLVEMVMGGK